jgi:hypothetical protein
MSGQERRTARQPATKFAHLRKKMSKAQLPARLPVKPPAKSLVKPPAKPFLKPAKKK